MSDGKIVTSSAIAAVLVIGIACWVVIARAPATDDVPRQSAAAEQRIEPTRSSRPQPSPTMVSVSTILEELGGSFVSEPERQTMDGKRILNGTAPDKDTAIRIVARGDQVEMVAVIAHFPQQYLRLIPGETSLTEWDQTSREEQLQAMSNYGLLLMLLRTAVPDWTEGDDWLTRCLNQSRQGSRLVVGHDLPGRSVIFAYDPKFDGVRVVVTETE